MKKIITLMLAVSCSTMLMAAQVNKFFNKMRILYLKRKIIVMCMN